MQGGPASAGSGTVLGRMFRRKLLIVAFTLFGVLAGLGLARVMQPVFLAETRIAIEPAGGQGTVDGRALAAQVKVLRSPELGERVVTALQLAKRKGFGTDGASGLFARLMAKFGLGGGGKIMTPEQRAMARYRSGLNVAVAHGDAEIAVRFAAGDAASAAEVANTLAELYVNETREAVPPPPPPPEPAPVVAERPSLAPQIAALRQGLAEAEQAVADYLARPRQPQPQQQPAAAPPVEEISALVARIAIAEAAREEAEAKLAAAQGFLAAQDPADAAIDAFASLAIQRLKEDHAAAELRLADLSLTYLPNHPKLIAAKKELANIARKLRREVMAVAAGLAAQVKAAEAREAVLRQALESLKRPAPQAEQLPPPFDAAELEVLQEQAAALRAALEEMLARDAEAPAPQEQEKVLDAPVQPAGMARIVRTAIAPATPVSPRPGPLAAIGGLAGFLLGLSLAFVASLAGGSAAAEEPAPIIAPSLRLDSRHDHGAYAAAPPVAAGSPILAAPPMPDPPPPIEAAAPEPELQMAAQYHADPAPEPRAPAPQKSQPAPVMTLHPLAALPARLSAAEVTESLSGGQAAPAKRLADSAALMAFWAAKARESSASRRFGILSFGCSPGDTSAAAVAMARALSRTKKKTVIVDLCRSGSSLEALLGTAAGPGIADLVSGAAEFTKVIARDSRSPVHLLRYGQDRSEWAMGLVEQHIESVLQALENAYDMLIVHAGDVAKETPGLVRHCHAALLLAPPSRADDAAVAIDALCTGALRDAQYVVVEEHAAQSVQAA